VFGAVAAAAIVLLVRIPITNSFLYIVALAAPASAVLALFTFNKVRAAMQSDKEAEELVASSIAIKELSAIAVVGGVALILLAAIATTAVRWFALAALVAFAVVLFVGGLFAPTVYLPAKQAEDKRNATKTKSGYVGAEKQD
jgi:Na+/H+ antiporter NhaC